MAQPKKGFLEVNYSDVFLCFHFHSGQTCQHTMKDHTLVYVYSGELLIVSGEDRLCVGAGECVFLPRNHRLDLSRQSLEHEAFKAIFLVFDRKFLRRFYQENEKSLSAAAEKVKSPTYVKLPLVTPVKSLFFSLVPFLESSVAPSRELLDLKQHEGVMALLDIRPELRTTLFDFVDPWKIDILDFLNENYMYELSISEIALFTGRSLAAFKRDFRKVSPLTPEKWIMQKRLEVARERLLAGGRASDIYPELGFKSLSHFSTAFKKRYGCSPQQVIGGGGAI